MFGFEFDDKYVSIKFWYAVVDGVEVDWGTEVDNAEGNIDELGAGAGNIDECFNRVDKDIVEISHNFTYILSSDSAPVVTR